MLRVIAAAAMSWLRSYAMLIIDMPLLAFHYHFLLLMLLPLIHTLLISSIIFHSVAAIFSFRHYLLISLMLLR